MTLQKTDSFSIDHFKSLIDRTENPSENNIAVVSVLNPQAQNNAALAFLANRFAEESLKVGNVSKPQSNAQPDYPAYKIYVKLPPNTDAVEYEQLEKSVIKTIFNKNGIELSRAALEEIAEKISLDFTSSFDIENKKQVYNPKNGLMTNAQNININGVRSKGYELLISQNTEKTVLAYSKSAQEITASGRKAFSELSGEERLKMTVARTGKYLPKDTAEALNMIDPRFLVAGVMTGATVSALAKRGIITSNGLLLAGGAVSLAQLLKYGGDAQHILDLVANAKKPEDLNKAAQALAELTKNGAVDLFLTATGYGAAKIAPKISGATGKMITVASEYGNEIAKVSKQKWTEYDVKVKKLGESLLPEAEYAGVPKQITNKTSLESINEPKKIVTVDSNGNPSGTRFRDDYEAHIKQRDYSNPSQKSGVSGAHNLDEFERFDISVNPIMTKNSIKILRKTPHPTVRGIYNIEYEMPKLNSKLQVIGWRLDSGKPFIKTVYDPQIISDAQMMQWGREAFGDAMQKNPAISGTSSNLRWEGLASNGLRFEGRVDTKGSEAVRTFYPKF